jgi:non-ribosomal peptide synthase protein (TIGR01720 family)
LHHDALRLSFRRDESGWEQFNNGAEAAVGFEHVDLSGLASDEQRLAIRTRAQELQTRLKLELGPLMRSALFHRGPDIPAQLLMVIHHLVVDGVSWRIILEDLQTAYEQVERGERIALPAKTSSFKQWMERLTQYARTSSGLQREREYWQRQKRQASIPVEFDGANITSSARVLRVSLSEGETRQLTQEVPQAYNTQINDVLLAAFLIGYRRWAGAESVLIDLEGHGREPLFDDLDLTRTVGWFTTIFPVLLDSDETEPPAVLMRVKEHLRAIPKKGIGYGLLKYLSREELRQDQRAQVSFNYLGQFDQGITAASLFRLSRDPSGEVCSPRAERAYVVEVNAMIVRKQLQVGWTYSQNVHSRGAIEDWAQIYIESLKDLIRHCVSPDAGGFTPSDFPEADLDAKELEAVLMELGE